MRRRVVFVRNPVSGRGVGARRWPEVERLLREHEAYAEIDVRATTGPEDAARFAREAAESGADVVVACGGDGTVNGVVTGIAGFGCALGLMPLGTGDDLARTLGLAGDLPLAVRTLFRGCAKPIDVGRWSCGGREGRFINVAGTGFDGVVAGRINRGYRFLRGTNAYVAAVLQTLATHRPSQMRIEMDGRPVEGPTMLCAVANAKCYGGGMQVAPEAEYDDGLFDVAVVGDFGAAEFLRTFPKVFRGAHLGHPKISMHRAQCVRIESDPPLPVLADGEVIGTSPVEFRLEERALRVLVPSEE
jgi:diacylglycerol kinase (ATP)